MDWTSVVGMEATYDRSNTQWNLTLLSAESTPLLFVVDFDHPHALDPDGLGWGEPLLAPLELDFAPGGEWQSDRQGTWRATVQPRTAVLQPLAG